MASIPRPPDVVTLCFQRNPFTGTRQITSISVIGSASPCRRVLVIGERLSSAVRCLLGHGFELICHTSDVWVFRRNP
ncbi:hypothetical protein LJK88_19015 [Paenibacillus sp. P26]|nr:hypothetical protein LJK88_19015 [Paenibacillus sp. P26]UUZ96202.1 hypothetical protein LJK87_18800 [Paenibacillus sp. P25]